MQAARAMQDHDIIAVLAEIDPYYNGIWAEPIPVERAQRAIRMLQAHIRYHCKCSACHGEGWGMTCGHDDCTGCPCQACKGFGWEYLPERDDRFGNDTGFMEPEPLGDIWYW